MFVFRPVFCLFCIFSIFFELPTKFHNNYLIMNRRLSMVYRFTGLLPCSWLQFVCLSRVMAGLQRAAQHPRLCLIICVSAVLLLVLFSQGGSVYTHSFLYDWINNCLFYWINAGGFINLCVLYCYCFILNIFHFNVFSSVKTCDTVSVFSVLVIRESWFGSRIIIIMMDLKQYDKVHHKTSWSTTAR